MLTGWRLAVMVELEVVGLNKRLTTDLGSSAKGWVGCKSGCGAKLSYLPHHTAPVPWISILVPS